MKTVLILGISADIGREMCERYLADGYRVIGTYRNRNGNVDMAESAEDVTLLQCDITSVDDIQKVRDAFREQRITWDVSSPPSGRARLLAGSLTSGQAMMPTAALACCMAALAVETMGNTPISAFDLRSSLEEILQP